MVTSTNQISCLSRYIYGFEIDFELDDLYESYLAADKYLLHHFNEAFSDYVKVNLNAENSCLIYDQLIKIGEREEISLASVRTVIIENSPEAFGSEHFTQIDRETLISLLSLDELSIAEIDLLTAVSKWVDCEVQRQDLLLNAENRRRVFEPIKGYVLFTDLTLEKIANRQEVAQLLTDEESGTLVLHLLNKNRPWKVELKTPRRSGSNFCSVFIDDARLTYLGFCSDLTRVTVNRRVSIRTIYTTYSERLQNVLFEILDSDGLDLGLKIERFFQDGRMCFSLSPPLVLEPNTSYTLKIDDPDGLSSREFVSQQKQLNFEWSVIFDLKRRDKYHCFRGFEFRFL